MNTNPKAKTILCYGDSNTHGTRPDRAGRWAADERWTGILQNELGDDYYVIEEGLGGRATDLEHPKKQKPGRNGFEYFKGCLESHWPLDVVIIMLGTNDLKTVYKRSVQDIADSLKQFREYINYLCEHRGYKKPHVILVSPPHNNDKAELFESRMPSPGIYNSETAQMSRHFAGPFKKVAEETECEFFDAATVAKTGEDGCHMDKESHRNFGLEFAKLISGSK